MNKIKNCFHGSIVTKFKLFLESSIIVQQNVGYVFDHIIVYKAIIELI